MKIKIYQIDTEKDVNEIKFMGYDSLEKFQGTSNVDSSIYNEVYSGEVEANDLEDVFRMFNTDEVGLHRGHSLSVSDVVETENGCYFCDTIGFKKIDFDTSQTYKPTDLLKVLYVEPNKPAVVGEMERGLSAIQRAVKGYYEQVYLDKDTVILCNEEAKLNGMKGNRHYNNGENVIAGPFVIVNAGEEDYESLTDEQIEKCMKEFGEPEEISDEETMNDVGFKFIPWDDWQ